jgi:hypothetical protein
MKKISIFLLLSLTIISCKNDKNKTLKNNQLENILYEGKHCFFSKIEDNNLVLEATIFNDSIKGNYDYYPKNGNINKGNFKGTLNGNVASTICEFSLDGKKIKEELVFKIDKNKVSILGGEKKEVNGVWLFIDKNNGIYMNDIPRRNCN